MEAYIQTIENAHSTLGLCPFAKDDEIRRAWRAKAFQTHPDYGGSANAFRAVQSAAKILLADGVREHYEAESCRVGSKARTQSAPPPRQRDAPTSEPERTHPRARRRPTLLAAAVFGYLIEPHLNQLGVTWMPLRDVCEPTRVLDSYFLIGWIFVKKRVH